MEYKRYSMSDLARAFENLKYSQRLLIKCGDGTVIFVTYETEWKYFIYTDNDTAMIDTGHDFEVAAERARQHASEFGGIAWERQVE